MKTPILILAYNRSDTLKKLIKNLKDHNAEKIYIYADFPASKADINSCQEVRVLINELKSWSNIYTFFPEKNLGPRYGVAAAINWFFEKEEEGIILEHDCIPSSKFFEYCSDLLVRYRENEKIMHISGTAPYTENSLDSDYYFIRIPLIWGWATWRRAWKLYDSELAGLSEFVANRKIISSVDGFRARSNWLHYFWASRAGNLQTWDYAWTFSIMNNSGLCVTPNFNMISNIGFGKQALHCKNTNSKFSAMDYTQIKNDFKHPLYFFPLKNVEKKLNCDVFKYKTVKYVFDLVGLNKYIAESKIMRKLIKKIHSFGIL